MKKITNLFFAAFALAVVLFVNLACSSLSTSKTAEDTAKPTNSATQVETPTGTAPEPETPKIEKADFTMTSEEYDKEFNREGVTDKDLEKYASKNIRVTGRVTLLSLEKKGTTQPWVTLFAPGLGNGVSCYFDDDHLDRMKKLKMDKVVTVQGFQGTLLVPKVSPMLDHCIVIKTD